MRVLMGLCCGLIFSGLKRFDKPGTWSYILSAMSAPFPVSYTHLDVYKRQALERDGHRVETRQAGGALTEPLCRWADCILPVSYTHLPPHGPIAQLARAHD